MEFNKVFIMKKTTTNMKRFIFSVIIGIFLISLASAAQDNLGTFQQGEDVTLIQICGTCTHNNITSIILPNSTHLIVDTSMTKRGMEYTYLFNETGLLGEYAVNGFGDLDGTDNAWAYHFTITINGDTKATTGEGIILVISIVVMALFALFFFVLGMKTNSGIMSLIFVFVSGVLLFTTVMFTVTTVSDNLSGLGSAMQGYSTYLLIIKSLVSISITFLVIYGLYRSYLSWGIKRGLRIE